MMKGFAKLPISDLTPQANKLKLMNHDISNVGSPHTFPPGNSFEKN